MQKNQNLKYNLIENQIGKSLFSNYKKSYFQIIFHLIVSIILFSPLFIGKFQMAGTDQYFNIFPDLFFGIREFREFGHFNYWNPFIFSGFDMTESMHSHFLHPIFWPILLFNEKYTFHIVTLIFFLFNFGLAIFWIKISRYFNLNKFSSSIVALTSQSSFFFWFGTINFIGVHLFFFSTYIIYLLCSFENRKDLLNFSLLTLSFLCLFITSHPGYVFGFSVVPVIFALYLFKKKIIKIKFATIFLLAIIFSIIASLHRILPIYLMLEDGTGSDPMAWSRGFTSAPYLILTLFNPSMFGNVLGDSLYFFETMNYPKGIHNAFHTSLYFGIGPLILILSSIFFKVTKAKIIMLITFILMLFQSTYFFEATYDFINIIFKPFNHSSIFKILSFYSFIFLLILSLKDFSQKNIFKKKINLGFIILPIFIVFIFSLGIYLDVINFLYTKEFQKFLKISEIIKVINVNIYFLFLKILFISGILYFIFTKIKLNFNKVDSFFKILILSIFLLLILTVFIGILAHKFGVLFIGAESYLTFIKNFSVLIVSLYTLNLYIDQKIKFKKLILFLVFSLIVSFDIGEKFTSSNIILSLHISLLGWLGSFCIITFYSLIFKKFSNKTISFNSFLLFFLIIHFIDLTISFKNNTFVNIWRTPFVNNIGEIYPIKSGENNTNLDNYIYHDIIKNYRFNNISFIDKYTDGHDLQASFGILSKKMSYAGVDSIFPKDYYDFLNYFLDKNEKNKLSRAGIVGDVKNERLLDILGVRVGVDDKKNIIIRPNAIPRISSFYNYKILNNKETLFKKLKDPNFDFTKNLIITKMSPSNSEESGTKEYINKKYNKINYELINNDNILINLNENHGRVVLFNDRYSKNWKAYWNDESIPIYKANSIFMSVIVPNGSGSLNFRFEPKLFIKLFKISNYILSFILFLIFISLIKLYYEKKI